MGRRIFIFIFILILLVLTPLFGSWANSRGGPSFRARSGRR